jgi:hypothetical protein
LKRREILSIAKKILIYVLIFVLALPIFYAGNFKKARADTNQYPPTDFGVDWSSSTGGGQPKINFYWKPPTNISQYSNPGLGKDINALQWVLNVTDTATNNHFKTWQDSYSKLESQYVGGGVIWGHSYTATLQLREPDGNNIGRADLSFTLPATGAGGNGTITSGCGVQNLAYKVELWPGETANQTAVLFSWAQPTANANCNASGLKDINAVKITNPNGNVLTNSAGIYGEFTDKNPVAGTYTFTSVAIGPVDRGTATINVSLQGGGTSITTPGTGSNGTGGTGGTPGSGGGNVGDQCQNRCGILKLGVVGNAICQAECFIISGLATIITWIINTVLYPALGFCPDGSIPSATGCKAP